MVTVCHTAYLTDVQLASARALCDLSYDHFGDEDSIYVLGHGLDLDGSLTCDWREGDVW